MGGGGGACRWKYPGELSSHSQLIKILDSCRCSTEITHALRVAVILLCNLVQLLKKDFIYRNRLGCYKFAAD